jgi:hypothetical protein
MSAELLHLVGAALRGPGLEVCPCVTCIKARQGDRRDAKLMLRAARLRLAEVTPAQRVKWDLYIEARSESGGFVPAAAPRV